MASTSSSSVTALPSTQGWTYDVFLSFRGPDIRKTFIDFLYESLERKGIRIFKNDDRLEKGDCISPSLLKAIQESQFSIAVFSKGYASSKWCLEELATMMECQEKFKEQIVVPIFYHVEPSDVRNQKGSFEDSFKELEQIFKDEEEKVRRWKEAMKKAGYLKGHHLQNDYNGHEATCAKGVAADILARLNQASLAFEENLVGLESRVNNIGNWLRLASDDDADADARFIGIYGMGGIGKTTIAMAVFNRFSHQFDGACFLALRKHNVIELQNTLLTEVLKKKSGVPLSDVQVGKAKIRMGLKGKKVLIVLDGVDDQLQKLDELAGGRDWFGKGSRVIITTRDVGVLRSHGVDKKYIYEVETLGEEEAIQLFSLFAFKKEATPGVKQLSGLIVHYAMGLPLVLKVLGSYLCGLKAVYWKKILVKLKDSYSVHTPKHIILTVLRISFDGLDPKNKNVFLHIACFLRNWREEVVKDVVDSDLLVLIEKSLISVQNGEIEMHDRIQEMGWYIASNENPRKMVWQLKDVDDVLSGNMEQIEGIRLPDPWPLENNTFKITLRGMRNLKMLKVGGDNVFSIIDDYLPSSLRWLEIKSYPFASLSERFESSKLVGLSLEKSSLQNCRITQKLHKLTLLDLSYSESLLETPDFDLMPNLMTLNLFGCLNLKAVHSSIGNLKKLVLMDLSGCNNLEELPCFNQVSCLKDLSLQYCSKLNNFPEIKERMPHLVELELREVGIIELPSSIQQLHGLTELYLDGCEHLVCLSNGFCELKNLKVLVINHCTNLKSLPENLQGLISLEYLNLNGSYFDSFPESFNQLPCLQHLDIRYCSELKVLPKLPKTIRQLYADPSFAFRGNIADVAKKCSELHSLAFSVDEERWPGHFLAKMCIRVPFQRKTPFGVNFPVISEKDPITWANALRFFQYRCYDSNGISISFRYCKSFVGFAVYFFSSEYDIWEPQFGQDIGDTHCTVIAKLSDKDDGNEVFKRKCVIAKPADCEDYYRIEGNMCFLYIPFNSLWPAESNTNINSVSPNDVSRFEVNFMNLEATADWGCSLLYKRRKRPFSWDGSRQGCRTDIGPSGMLKYLNLSGKEFKHFLPEDISRLRRLQYLDISGCRGIMKLPELPATIRELYANTYLALESNIVELATKYSKLYSVSFSQPIYIDLYPDSLVPGELAKKFIPITQPFLNRNTPFAVTYPFYTTGQTDHYYISRCFKYPHHDPYHDPHKISVSLDPTWYSHNFVGFVVCFVFPWLVKWESRPDIHPFRSCKLITKLTHKDNGREPPLETECVIGRLNDEEFDESDDDVVCFVYIPFSSLWPKSKAITDNITPNHYLIFEATIQDLEFSTHWSCGLLCTNNESLTQVIRQEREVGSSYKESGSSKSDSEEGKNEDEEETKEEEEDGGSEYIEDSGGDDAMAEDINPEETYGLMASTSAVTASPSIQGWTYDVFLSFRGPDIRKTFIDFLYELLERKGIRTFKDDDRLEKGDCISPNLLKGIQESQFLIAVFSKGYALSKWCLEELATMMECHEKFKRQIVVPIFYHVEPSDVQNQKGSFEDSFKELLEKIGKDDEEKVRRWKEALKKAGELKGYHLQKDYNGYEATCAEKVAADIHARLNQASLAFEENLVGLESRVNNIGNWLRLASDDNDDDVRFIGIYGMGGIGKTTIATAVFNRFSHQFDAACFLADVRQHNNVIELQKTLLTKVLKEKSAIEINTVEDGMAMIRRRLKRTKVLIVLDDVDNTVEQLEKLAGGQDWFGKGSRVIITTRDAGVLRSHGVDKEYIHEVQTLEEQEAIQLFSLHAFKKKIPKTGFEALCGLIVHYAIGFPLALKVLGSSLCGLEATDWESTLEELKDTPNNDIVTKLKICFDRLDSNSKNIFLHIACFFRHEKEEHVNDVLNNCDLQPVIGMRILIEKSLISVLEGRIEMHDLIQEMGWHIASLDRPRSRVWQLKDVDDVLSGNMDPKHNEGTLLPSAGDINEENISELKLIDLKFYPFTSLPESFTPSKLVWFSLHHSYLKNFRINQKLDKLIYLDLNSSSSLLETPNFDWMPNLMRLNLSDCQKLKKIHSSIGNLRKLILLDLGKCHDLKRLPSFNQVSSLRSLNLLGCIRLENFPEVKARTPHLVELDLKMVGIKELSSSIQNLHGLTRLCLDQCPHLVRLCNGLCELRSLKVLEIKNCRNLKSLPEGLISLEYLNFQGCCFDSLPESFSQLTCLQYLSITDCEIPNKLPKLPANVKELYADCGFKIAELAIQYSKLNLVSFSTGDQHGIVTSLAKKFIHFPLHRKTPFCVSYCITSVDLEKSKMLRTFKYRHYKSNGICINLESSWYSEKFMGFVVCFYEKEGNIWGQHSYQAIDNSIHSCTVVVKLSHKDNKDEVLQIDCVIAVSSFDNSDIYGTICCAYIPVSSLWGKSKALKDYSRFEVHFMNVKASADWGCSLLYERAYRQTGATTTHISTHGGSDSGLTTDDIGCSSPLELETEYLNLNRRDFACLPKLPRLQYLDISGCRRLLMLPKLPATIRELYAHSNLAFESNIAELASKYSELYSVSFSNGYVTLCAEELAREFVRVPFQNRNSPFLVTYPTCDDLMTDVDTKRWFKYSSCHSNKVSINLNPSWYSQIFVGFVVCFLLKGRNQKWESRPEIRPFRYSKIIAKLRRKDSANEILQTNCVIARLYDEEFDEKFEECKDSEFICFAYIPCSSLLSKCGGNPNDYSVFEVAFLDSNSSSDWSCGLLYKNDDSLSQAIWSKASFIDSDSALFEETPTWEEIQNDHYHHIEEDCETTTSQQQLGLDITKPWQLTEIVHQIQCLMVSMPDCFDAKVAGLLYTKSGVGIMTVSLNGIYKVWKWSHNRQNPSAKATANSVPQYWQTNSGLLKISDASGVNIEEVVPCIALSNDGYFVASAFGRKISLFSMKAFGVQEMMTTFMSPSASTFLAHDPCVYENIAIGTEGSFIYLYNFVKEKVIAKLNGHEKRITGLAFSTNPYMLVSSGADAQLCVWNILGRGKKRKSVRIQLPTGEVHSGDIQVMFHADQLHLLVTHETQLTIYDTSKMERISQWIPHGSLSSPISSATYSNNSLLVYASFNDGNIGVLDAHSLRLRCRIAPSAYLSQAVSNRSRGVYPVAIVAHPQKTNQFAIGLTNGTVKVIEPREFERKWGASPTIGNEHSDDEKTPIFEDSDEEASMTEDSDAEALIMTEDSDEEASIKEDSDEEALIMTEDSDEEASIKEDSDEETTMIEDSDEETRMIEDNSEEAPRITTLATSQQELGQNRTKPWQLTEIVDPIQCRMVSMPECFDAKVVRILYTMSGIDILALSSDGIHKLWKWFYHNQNPSRKATANYVPQYWQTYSGLHVSGVNFKEIVPCIALPNSASLVALAVGEKVSLFDIETFEEKTTFMCQSASTFLAFHPCHNNILAIGMEDSTINIYNVWENEVKVNLKEGHRKRITGLAFSTNLLVSSSADAQLCAWSIDTWKNRISVPFQLRASEVLTHR